jgi:hypothetical protein
VTVGGTRGRGNPNTVWCAKQECIIAEYDLDFNERGYDDMTDMRKLNDCELARSLRLKFEK